MSRIYGAGASTHLGGAPADKTCAARAKPAVCTDDPCFHGQQQGAHAERTTIPTPGPSNPRHGPGVARLALITLSALAALSAPLAGSPTVHPPQATRAAQATAQPTPRATPSAASRSHIRPSLPVPTVRQVTRRPAKSVTRTGPRTRLSDRALAKLASCESPGDGYRAVGAGVYGRYQYNPTTWRNLWRRWGDETTARLRPDRAAPAVQDATIRRHWIEGANPRQQWPGCTRKLGAWWAL